MEGRCDWRRMNGGRLPRLQKFILKSSAFFLTVEPCSGGLESVHTNWTKNILISHIHTHTPVSPHVKSSITLTSKTLSPATEKHTHSVWVWRKEEVLALPVQPLRCPPYLVDSP